MRDTRKGLCRHGRKTGLVAIAQSTKTRIAILILIQAVCASAEAGTAFPVSKGDKAAPLTLVIFQRFDADRNGQVTRKEYDAGRLRQLAGFDTNKDGRTAVDEITGLFSARLAKRGNTDKAALSQKAVIKADANGDGLISFDEFAATGDVVFEAADANRDGVITAAEAQHWASGGMKSAQ